jgi:class 3 adenylate cyclase
MLRTAVLMKTDIANSTRQFRALLQDDLHSLLLRHRSSLERFGADWGGQIFRAAGDGYWLEFPSVTAAAKAAIHMQEALRRDQPSKGDDRLSMRVVIGVGEVVESDGELIGEIFALLTRIEAITPADEIYLTAAARQILTPAEIQAALVDSFQLKGFAEPVQVYRVDLRHRTRIVADASIVLVDLRGFTELMLSAPVSAIERALDALDTTTHEIARGLGGSILFNVGDSYLVNFTEPCKAIAAAEQLERAWNALSRLDRGNCGIHLVVHFGTLYCFRSFMYGEAMRVAGRAISVTSRLLADREGGVFVTRALRETLPEVPWHDRLQFQALELSADSVFDSEVYRLSDL